MICITFVTAKCLNQSVSQTLRKHYKNTHNHPNKKRWTYMCTQLYCYCCCCYCCPQSQLSFNICTTFIFLSKVGYLFRCNTTRNWKYTNKVFHKHRHFSQRLGCVIKLIGKRKKNQRTVKAIRILTSKSQDFRLCSPTVHSRCCGYLTPSTDRSQKVQCLDTL